MSIHAGVKNNCKVKVNWIHSEDINDTNVGEKLSKVSVLVTPGFEIEDGKVKYLDKIYRKNNIPFFWYLLSEINLDSARFHQVFSLKM